MGTGLEPADEQLVSLSKDGNLDAFNSLVERYQGPVYNLCLRLLGSREAAEDAAQETFVSAYRAIARFSEGSVKSWLLRIASNESKDELRKRKRRGPRDSIDTWPEDEEAPIDLPDPGEGALALLERREVGRALQAALMAIPFDQRQAVILADIQGYHYQEIARMTGTNVGTVKSRIYRGRERLRQEVGARPELFGPHGRLSE